MKKIIENARKDIFKSFYCSMCTIEEPDNISIIDDCGNLQKKENFALLIRKNVAYDGIKFLISGTDPQYYYNHLLLSTVEHYSTYMIFDDSSLFKAVFGFSKDLAFQTEKAKLVFNGNFGSDIWHFHVHVTDTAINYVENETKDTKIRELNGNFGVINYKVLVHTDLNTLYKRVFELTRIMYSEDYISRKRYLSAVFKTVIKNGLPAYFVFLVTGTRGNVAIGNESYVLFFPAGALNTNRVTFTESKVRELTKSITINDCYTSWNNVPLSKQPKQSLRAEFFEINYRKKCSYNFLELPDVKIIFNIVKKCISEKKNCGEENSDVFATYKYAMSLAFICEAQTLGGAHNAEQITYKKLIKDHLFLELAFKSGISYLTNNYNIRDSNSLFIKGPVATEIFRKSFNNFNLLTSKESHIPKHRLVEQTNEVNEWIDVRSKKQIGKASAFGIVYSYAMKQDPNIEFVIKTINPTKVNDRKDPKLKDMIMSEFAKGIKINDLREHIPNFIITLGGFECVSSPALKTMCLGFDLFPTQFLMIEKVNSKLAFSDYIFHSSPFHIAAGIQQIAAALYYAQLKLDYTHYDLHTDNVMVSPLPEAVLYKYNFEGTEINVPAFVNCSIIDYDKNYIKGIKHYFVDEYSEKYYGMTSDRPNFNRDIYTVVIHSFLKFLEYKALKDIEAFYRGDNLLKYLIVNLFDAYPDVFHPNAFNIIMNTYMKEYANILNPNPNKENFLIDLFNGSRLDTHYYLYLPIDKEHPKSGLYQSQFHFIQTLSNFINVNTIPVNKTREYRWGDYESVGCFADKVKPDFSSQIAQLKTFINSIKPQKEPLKTQMPKETKSPRKTPKAPPRASHKRGSPVKVSATEAKILEMVREANVAFKKNTNCNEILGFYSRVWTVLANERAIQKGEPKPQDKVINTTRDFRKFRELVHSDKQKTNERKLWADEISKEINEVVDQCKQYLRGK